MSTEILKLVIEAESKKARNDLKQTREEISKLNQKSSKDFEDVKKHAEAVEKSFEDVQKGAVGHLSKASSAAKDFEKNTSGSMKGAGASTAQLEKQLSQMLGAMASGFDSLRTDVKSSTSVIGTGFDSLSADSKQLSSTIGASFGQMSQDSQAFQKALENAFKKAGNNTDEFKRKASSLKSDLRDLSLGAGVVTTAATASVALAGKQFGDFQAELNTLQAVSGAAEQEMASLSSQATELATVYKYSSSEIASTSVELAKLGFVSSEIQASLEGIIASASSSGVELRDAGELIAGTLRGFKLEASEAARVADILAQAANTTALDFGSIAYSMKYIAPIAAASSQRLEEMTAVLGVLSNNMIKGEQAGTSVRAMLSRLQNQTSEMTEVFDELSMKAEGADGKLKSLPAIFEELRQKMANMSETARNEKLAQLFGTEALSAAAAIYSTSAEDLQALIDKMDSVSGAASHMSNIMNQGLNYSMDQLKSSAQNTAIVFGKELEPALVTVIDTLKEVVDWAGKLPAPVKAVASQAGLATLAFSGLIGLLGGSSFAILSIIDLFGRLTLSLEAAGVQAGLLQGTLMGLLGATGVGLLLGGGVNLAMNTIASNLNAQSAQKEQMVADAQQYTGGISNAIRQGDNATLEELSKAGHEAVANIQRLKPELDAVNGKIDEHLRKFPDLRNQYGKTNDAVYENLKAEKESLNQQIQKNERLRDTYQGLISEKRASNAETKKATDAATEAAKAQDALNQAQKARKDKLDKVDKQASEDNKSFYDGLSSADEKFETAQKNLLSQRLRTADQIVESDNAMGESLVANAEKVAVSMGNSYGKCLTGVNIAFNKTFGNVLKYTQSAYQAIDALEKDKRFKEVDWDKKSTLPAGTVVAWEQGSSPHGHISIADGKGNEISDHKTKQRTSHYGGGRARVFVPSGQEGSVSKINKQAEAHQEQINASLAHYNSQLDKALAKRTELEKKGLGKEQESWRKANAEVEKYQKKISELKNESENISHKLQEQLAKLQEQNFKALDSALSGLTGSLNNSLAAYQKELNQMDMGPLQKKTTQFAENASKAEIALGLIKVQSQAANVSTEQRNRLLSKAETLESSIVLLKKTQAELLDKEKQKLQEKSQLLADEAEDRRVLADLQAMPDSMEKELAILKQQTTMREKAIEKEMKEAAKNYGEGSAYYKSLETDKTDLLQNEVDARIRILNKYSSEEKAREFSRREIQINEQANLGKISQEDAIKQLLVLNKEKRRVAEDELEIAKWRAQLYESDVENSKEVIDARAKINALDSEGNHLLNEGKEIALSQLERENQLRQQVTQQIINASGALMEMNGISREITANLLGGIADASHALANTQIKIDEKKSRSANWGDLISGDILKPAGGDPMSMIVSLGVMGAKNFKGAIDQVLGVFTPINDEMSEVMKRAEEFKEYSMNLAIELESFRLEKARSRGLATLEMEKSFIQAEANQRLRQLDKEGEALKNKRGALWGFAQTAAEKDAYDTWLKKSAAQREKINAETLEKMYQMELEYQERVSEASLQANESIQNARIRARELAAQNTSNPLDNIEVDYQADRQKAFDKIKSAANLRNDIYAKTGIWHQDVVDEAEVVLAGELKEAERKRSEAIESANQKREEGIRLLEQETAILRAQQTDSPYDDIYANADKELEQIRQDREEALEEEGITEEKKQKIRDFYREKERLARKKFSDQIANTRKAELKKAADDYKELLLQQRTLIQEQIEDKTREYEGLIRAKETEIRAAENRLKAEEERLAESRRNRLAETESFNKNDSTQFNDAIGELDSNPASWSGVKEISNTQNVSGLPQVSGETGRLGLLKQIELMEKRAYNDLRKEAISQQDYVKIMQEAQVMRAKAAEMELATELLTTEREIELQDEWATAYVKYQELAKQAIDDRYDTQDAAIQKSIDSQHQEIKTMQDSVSKYRNEIQKINDAAADDLTRIDDAIKAAERSTRDWAGAWSDVASGISSAFAALESSSSSVSRNQGSNVANYGQSVATGTDGKTYQTTSELWGLPGLAKGGGIPSKYTNDSFFTRLDSQETAVPLDSWREQVLMPLWDDILSPQFTQLSTGGSRVYAPKHDYQIHITGNSFGSMSELTSALDQYLDDRADRLADEGGFLFG